MIISRKIKRIIPTSIRRFTYILFFGGMIGIFILGNNLVYASDVQVTSVGLVDRQETEISIEFSLSWKNSFRFANFHDALWVFAKYYSKLDSQWHHATIKTSGYSTGDGEDAVEIVVPTDGKGFFMRRGSSQYGVKDSVEVQNAKVVWNWLADGIDERDKVKINLYAIEMVYVPQGTLSAGSIATDIAGSDCFYQNGATSPKSISNENAITLQKAGTNLCYNTLSGAVTLPANYPKGVRAFYIMKHELSQGSYAGFLDSLTVSQQNARFMNKFNDSKNVIKKVGVNYGCDADDNNVLNEMNAAQYLDGQGTACNFINWKDATAFVDWAGLRPMSEFEYEKVCKGTESTTAEIYAWSSAQLKACVSLENEFSSLENSATYFANINIGNNLDGPVRIGMFSDLQYDVPREDRRRDLTGASYYGVMELSGNVAEICVRANLSGAILDYSAHGDGELKPDSDSNPGESDVSGWPIQAGGYGIRGGGWSDLSERARTADRADMNFNLDTRDAKVGFRGVRTAP